MLKYAIPNQPVTVHDLLLQKSDGTLVLIVWNERVKGNDEVTVQLGRPYSEVKVFDPTISIEPIQTRGRTDSLRLRLSDHPLILAIELK